MRDLVVGVVLACLLVSGCSGGDPETSPRPDSSGTPSSEAALSAPAPEPPEKGACYRLSFDEALAPIADGDAVKCRRKHTSETFAVGRLALREGGELLTVDSDRAQRQAARACTKRLGRFLGADREQLRLSLLATVWFTPTLEEGAAGGRWFRCDVIATAGANRLMKLPRDLKGSLADFSMCATSEPGRQDSHHVACSRPHAWRALSTVDLAGASYPSAEKAADAMEEPCRSRARAAADDPLDFTWSEERPTREQWDAGQRYGICWVPE